MLFIIYLNDIERYLQGATPNMYADDTSINCSSSDCASQQRNIDIEMANVAEWMRQNRLRLNANRGVFMVISHSRHCNSLNELEEIKVNQEIIGRVTETKHLGLNIDEYLSWKDQYEKLKIRLKVASLPFRG